MNADRSRNKFAIKDGKDNDDNDDDDDDDDDDDSGGGGGEGGDSVKYKYPFVKKGWFIVLGRDLYLLQSRYCMNYVRIVDTTAAHALYIVGQIVFLLFV